MSETLRKFRVYSEVFGWAGYWLALKTRLARAPYERSVQTSSGPVCLRLKTSDLNAYDKVFLQNDYDFSLPSDPAFIVDAGANIGFAAIYYARRYPAARIIAIEAERSNFELLRRNVRPFKNIVPLHAALWRDDTTIDVIDPGIGHWGFQVAAAGGAGGQRRFQTVEAWSVPSLMQRLNLPRIDLLKVDIEGAEKEVFESSAGWIDRVQAVVAELHDRLKPGCSEAFLGATSGFPVRQEKGENIFRARTPGNSV